MLTRSIVGAGPSRKLLFRVCCVLAQCFGRCGVEGKWFWVRRCAGQLCWKTLNRDLEGSRNQECIAYTSEQRTFFIFSAAKPRSRHRAVVVGMDHARKWFFGNVASTMLYRKCCIGNAELEMLHLVYRVFCVVCFVLCVVCCVLSFACCVLCVVFVVSSFVVSWCCRFTDGLHHQSTKKCTKIH